MADEGIADTFEYPVNGRVLVLRRLKLQRIAMLERYWNSMQARLSACTDAAESFRIDKKMSEAFWGVIESQFINPDDLEFVQTEIMVGRLDEGALAPILSGGYTRPAAEDDADPAPAKRAGRKAPAKKAAKKASPRAAKR